MDIAEIRKKAKKLKDKLQSMEESIKVETSLGRKALEDSAAKAEEALKDEVPIEITPEAQKESNFKMAEALEMGGRRDREEVKTESRPKVESKDEADVKPEALPGGESCQLLSDEEAAEFKALTERALKEEALETKEEPALTPAKDDSSSLVMPDLLDIDELDGRGDSSEEKTDLSLFEDSEGKKPEMVEEDKEVKKSAKTSDITIDSSVEEDDEIEWGMEEELDDIVDFEIEALIFSLGNEKYAMDIQILSEVIVSAELIDVPRAPQGTEGLLSLRGQIIPVMDLMERLGLEGQSKKSRILILKDDEFFLGFYVDSVDDVIGFTAEELEPSPTVTSIDSSLIESLGRHDGRPYIILNMNNILEKI